MIDFAGLSYTDMFFLLYNKPFGNFHLDTRGLWNVKEKCLEQENKYKKGNAIYVHIPFCVKQCSYCAWCTMIYERSKVPVYLDALRKEISMVKNTPYMKTTKFDSMYFGGGTPSCLSADDIYELLTYCRERFSFTDGAEISFEANPSSLTEEKIRALKEAGATRVSLGVQSFNNQVLRSLNCAHTSERAKKLIDSLSEAGLLLNVDLIYGLIGQKASDWQWELENLCKISPGHVTLYPLRIFPQTPLYLDITQHGKSKFDVKEHENILERYDSIAAGFLRSHSYIRNEFPFVYAKKGCSAFRYIAVEARAIGFGLSAGGFLDNGESRNYYEFDKYVEAINQGELPVAYEMQLTQQQVHERFILFRILYMDRSLPNFKEIVAKRFKEYFGCNMGSLYDEVIDTLSKYGMIEIKDGIICITPQLWEYFDNFKILY